ncbi:MAG: UDP-N-acetylmuramoyl-L-alanyl-D-glutamate--2,6-diaminopimelate ligase [Myxococcales bacterium]
MNTSLRELSALVPSAYVQGDDLVQVSGVTSDSRAVVPGDLFVALVGGTHDGTRFAPGAIERGARAVLSARPLTLQVPTLVVDDVRAALGPIAQRVCGEPTRAMPTVGITGTNGKTTVSYLLESVLARAGMLPALLGTVALRGPAGEQPAQLTTPEADAIARFAQEQRQAGARSLVMEVSSHALEQGRVRGMHFEVAAFTNLTQDHLDYHGTMEAYGAAKVRLFTEYAPPASVIMVDQAFGWALAERVRALPGQRVFTCSADPSGEGADFQVREYASLRTGIKARLTTPQGELGLTSPLFGAHNLENLLVVLGCAHALGVDLAVAVDALATAVGAPGRLERVDHPGDVLVLVDYAHTPDALERALRALRPLTRGRLFAVCGCGGDRDRTKRAPMGEAAAREADLAILTSDNPRTEDPKAILAEMEPGAQRAKPRIDESALAEASSGYTVVVDRTRAIELAMAAAKPGDSVLLAGKGHETYQIVGKTKHDFDDRREAARAVASLRKS